MEATNLTLEQQLILLLTESYIRKNSFEALGPCAIGNIRGLAQDLSRGLGQPKEQLAEKKSYPPFGQWMSEKTIRRLQNHEIYTPEQLAKHDFGQECLYGFIPNIELLQYAMVADIKLINYRY